jgi:hypothetical protein
VDRRDALHRPAGLVIGQATDLLRSHFIETEIASPYQR